MQTIAVIDYGMGNLRSVAKALEHVAGSNKVVVTSAPETIAAADRIVFPGQGAIGAAMQHLRQRNLLEPLREAIDNKPFLGLCLGLQVLMQHSDEDGGCDGLNAVPGGVHHFDRLLGDSADRQQYKVPHMGWNSVEQAGPHPLWNNISQHSRFYFVHSYYIDPEDFSVVAGWTEYGRRFACAVARDNLFATQFHPEKSQRAGLQLLQNFVHWNC